MSDGGTYRFVCPECDNAITVTDATKEALTSDGCVLCGTAVSGTAFTPV